MIGPDQRERHGSATAPARESPDWPDGAVPNVADTFLRRLRDRGVGHLFLNSGTDFAPIVEAYAQRDGSPDYFPRPIVVGHEGVAMGMAHGAYLMNGHTQAVMFHVNVGTANAVCAALNVAAERVPVLICAGRTSIHEKDVLGARNTRVAWGQEMYDQAGLIREAVKWDYELRDARQVADVVDRALTIAETEPRGASYLTLAREVIAAPSADQGPSASTGLAIPSAPFPDPDALARLADALAAARMPVISSLAAGADTSAVALLVDLCDRFAIGFVEEQARYLNLPSSHPLHLGYELGPTLREADVQLFIECDVPWIPEAGEPRPDAFVVQAGVDPTFGRYPIRTHRSDLTITSAAAPLLLALRDAMEARRDRIDPMRRDRLVAIATGRRKLVEDRRAAEREGDGPIDMAFLNAVMRDVVDEDCVLFNEYWGDRRHYAIDRAGSYFYLPAAGGLGWSLPAALGAKLAAPASTMIAMVGDGAYMFCNPAACHHAAAKHDLPVLTVIANNARWNAVDLTARMVYPEGRLTRSDRSIISDLSPTPAFEHYCVASGGHGEAVSDRRDLEAALRRALDVVRREKRQAVVNVHCA